MKIKEIQNQLAKIKEIIPDADKDVVEHTLVFLEKYKGIQNIITHDKEKNISSRMTVKQIEEIIFD